MPRQGESGVNDSYGYRGQTVNQVTNDFRPLVIVMDGHLVVAIIKGPHGMPAPVARAIAAKAMQRATTLYPGTGCEVECVRWGEAKKLMPDGFSECASFDVVDIGDTSTIPRPRDVREALEER